MAENQHKAATEILLNSLAPAQETETQETAQPTEDHENELQTSETLETQEAEASPEPEKEQEEDISTLNHLAETLDIPIEDMYALNFNMPNGDPVSLGALKDFYESNSDLESARQEIENERSQLQADKDKLKEVPPVSEEHVQALASVMAIQNEWNALENSGLRASNPGEYSAKAVELQNRYQQANGFLQNIQQVIEAKRTEKLQQHQVELHKLQPDLKDEEKRQKAVKRVSGMFEHYGVDPSYIGLIEDYKAVNMLLEMSKLFEQKGNYKNKRIDTSPRVLKPQAVRNSEAGKQASLKRLTEKARQSGQRRDQINAVSALLRK